MCEKLYCCRTRIRLFFTLSICAAVFLFIFNVVTQIADIPSSLMKSDSELNQRNVLIDEWRKQRGMRANQPLIAPVPCKGDKCDKFMGVLGLDESVNRRNNQHCKHPVLSLANDSIAHTFSHLPPLNCHKNLKCGYSQGKIRVEKDWICLLQTVNRPVGEDSVIQYASPLLITVSTSLPAKREGDFFRLSCVAKIRLETAVGNTDMERISTLVEAKKADEEHLFSRISKYPEGEPTPCSKEHCLQYNVFVLGIGSLSRMSFQRLLPLTYNYFTSTMKSMVFDGFNVVGNSGSDALLPLLTGLEENSQPQPKAKKVKDDYVGKLDLLWNAYDSHGYMTLYAEDNPSTNTFNSRFKGFAGTPTAHYMRPFWLAAQSDNTSKEYCLGSKPKHRYVLDYLLDFQSAYRGQRKFSLAMLKGLTHGDIMPVQHLDHDLLQFMKKMGPYLKDTIVLLMSDYGVLPKQSWSSRQSKTESRMPLLSIYLPTSFMKNHTKYARAMVSNEDKLVTPYDVHHTLKDIIDRPRLEYEDPRDKGRFGQSLFKPVPISRTCKDAGVDVHWCACHTSLKVLANEVDNDQIKDVILAELNERTSSSRDHCSPYKEVSIISITRLVPNEQISEFELNHNAQFNFNTLLDENYYQVTFTASVGSVGTAGRDTYEVTLEHSKEGVLAVFSKSYRLVSDIIPLDNMYRHSCVQDLDILKYCSCSS